MIMNATERSIFAALPNELVREILEHAAAADAATALALSLVATWVRPLVEPMLYHTVVLSTSRAVTAFVATLAHKPAHFAPATVKHLGIFALGPVEAIDRAIDACKGVESLACGFSLPSYQMLHGCTTVQALACPREQHLLGLSCRDGWDISLVGPTVTHLRIHLSAEQTSLLSSVSAGPELGRDDFGWNHLSSLASLTHLAIVFRPSPSCPATAVLAPIMALFASQEVQDGSDAAPRSKLSMILVQVTGSASSQGAAVEALNAEATARGGDALRVVAEAAPSSAASQWEHTVRGGKSVWENAEQVVRRRLAAQEQPSRSD